MFYVLYWLGISVGSIILFSFLSKILSSKLIDELIYEESRSQITDIFLSGSSPLRASREIYYRSSCFVKPRCVTTF